MKKSIIIAHLASFSGNTGDILSHLGFRKWFESFFDVPVIWKNFEIRNTYRGLSNLDEDYVDVLSTSDLGIIGGGNFLELWPENSQTGTSLNFNSDRLDSLDYPIFFNSLGVDDGQGISESAKNNFEKFVNQLERNPNRLLTVRNDGAFETLTRLIPSCTSITEIPDHGFFGAETLKFSDKSLVPSIAVNIAIDMPGIRFSGFESINNYYSHMAEALAVLAENRNLHLVFVPHVYSDLEAIYQTINLLPDQIRREQTRVVALDTTSNSTIGSFNAYLESDLVIAARFHANVFSIAHNIPTISISNYPQLTRLHSKLGNTKFKSKPLQSPNDFPDFVSEALHLLNLYQNSIPDINNSLMSSIHQSRDRFRPILDEWLILNKLKQSK